MGEDCEWNYGKLSVIMYSMSGELHTEEQEDDERQLLGEALKRAQEIAEQVGDLSHAEFDPDLAAQVSEYDAPKAKLELPDIEDVAGMVKRKLEERKLEEGDTRED